MAVLRGREWDAENQCGGYCGDGEGEFLRYEVLACGALFVLLGEVSVCNNTPSIFDLFAGWGG